MLERSLQDKLIRWYYTPMKQEFLLEEDTYENWVILAADEGGFNYQIGEEHGTVKFGEMILCPPGITLHRQATTQLSFLFIEFSWHDEEGKPVLPGPDHPYGKITFHRLDRYTSTLAFIRELSELNADIHITHKEHLLKDILFLYMLERRENSIPITARDPVVRAAMIHIQNHAFEPLSLKLLADQASLSQSQFSRRFQADTGISPITYLTAIRMRKAQSLLLSTKLNLEEIALLCGYQNGFYLSRVFTNTYHLSPSAFRKTYRI